ncbi:type I-E CRISPR-associated protein Cas5/CasD [Streptomyces sp. WMMC1477]|uniref:type I-E CRISPR-associated protein Cas5/CasD n=1 Tax=Streptomyces sp. WMMC1477 TaxID=3015155 RepID=UPI0022B74F30|nr:type I-E CRISPR-associated protein Cas5/CasD [Streptomyces sp. WMMC1477]MCZ7432312.1 type I-E CRISPR-associated protein Cas5/CasD [Streptomyces sp. WMMC1477]
MTVLLLRLAGPLQSWGSAARFARRGTENAPTKSGVLGLLAAAEGRRRDADLSDLATLRFGVRIDQPGSQLRDFHTAHHADSGKPMPLSERFYLADAMFVAGVEGDTELLRSLHRALLEPRFLPYLGRRSCPPSRPIDMGPPQEGVSLEDALRGAEWEPSPWYLDQLERTARQGGGPVGPESLDLLIDCPPGETPHLSLRDTPVSFDPRHRQYGLRGMLTERTSVPPPHDPTAALRPVDPPTGGTPGSFPRTS